MMSLNAKEHLRKRLVKLGETYHDRWPRWTYDDYVAVGELLQAESRLHSIVERAVAADGVTSVVVEVKELDKEEV